MEGGQGRASGRDQTSKEAANEGQPSPPKVQSERVKHSQSAPADKVSTQICAPKKPTAARDKTNFVCLHFRRAKTCGVGQESSVEKVSFPFCLPPTIIN